MGTRRRGMKTRVCRFNHLRRFSRLISLQRRRDTPTPLNPSSEPRGLLLRVRPSSPIATLKLDLQNQSWRCCCPAGRQASQRPNARRVSPPKQDLILAKFTGERYQGTTFGFVLPVRPAFSSLSFLAVAFWAHEPSSLSSHVPNLTHCPLRYPNLYEVRLIPTKRDIAFVEYMDEGSAGVAKDALHNFKLDGENKIKVRTVAFLRFSFVVRANDIFIYFRSRMPGSKLHPSHIAVSTKGRNACQVRLSSFLLRKCTLTTSCSWFAMYYVSSGALLENVFTNCCPFIVPKHWYVHDWQRASCWLSPDLISIREFNTCMA